VNYTLTYTNFSPETITGITVTDILGSGLQFVGSVPSPTLVSGTNEYIYDFPSLFLAPGQTGSIELQAVALDAFSGFNYLNTGMVSGGNAHVVSLPFVPNSADLVIQKTGSTLYAASGELVGYTITVTNNGPDTVNSLTINDIL
jgi:hypothetical protein